MNNSWFFRDTNLQIYWQKISWSCSVPINKWGHQRWHHESGHMTFAGNNFWYATPYLKRYPWKSGPKQIWQKSENVWLYVLVMSRTRLRVNPHSTVAWMSRNSLLEAGAKWLSVRLRTKWFWVRVQLQSENVI